MVLVHTLRNGASIVTLAPSQPPVGWVIRIRKL